MTTQESYTKKDVMMAQLLKALAHPARIAILRQLARRNSCVCGEIVDHLPLAQATVSQHLKVMKEAGLILGEIDGPRTCYCINADVVNDLDILFDSFLTKVSPKRCC